MRWLAVLVVVLACKSPRKEVPAPTGSGSNDWTFEPGHSGANRLGFTITQVWPAQHPIETPPYYAAGGSWTYFAAHVDGDPEATFVIGLLPSTSTDPESPVQPLKTYLVPTTSDAGARVVTAFARAFAVAVPPPAPGRLAPLDIESVSLGGALGKTADGFAGRGTWQATKWFCSTDDIESAEVFFNISLATKQGELSQKDSDYDADIATCLAVALRDGGPLPRTPDNDPTLALTGPRLVLGKQLTTGPTHEIAITPTRVVLVEERAGKAVLIDVDPRTGATKDLYTTKDRIELGYCDDTATRCVLIESTPTEERNVFTGNDPQKLMLLDQRAVTPLVVAAFGERPELARLPISPDGRIVVVRTSPGGPVTRLIAWNRSTKGSARTTIEVSVRGETDVVGWRKGGDSWVALLESTEEDKPSTMFDWRVDETGTLAPSKAANPGIVAIASPDGTRRAQFTDDGKLTITPISGAARTLVFHKSDRRYVGPDCCTWLDNRYLQLRGDRVGFIDTDAMKVSFAAEPLSDDARLEIIYGLRKALVIRDTGAQLATIEGP